MIYCVDLLKDAKAALQHVGVILQTASSLKFETSAEELCMTHTQSLTVHAHTHVHTILTYTLNVQYFPGNIHVLICAENR